MASPAPPPPATRMDAILAWLERHRARIDALPYGSLAIDFGPSKVDYKLTEWDSERVAVAAAPRRALD